MGSAMVFVSARLGQRAAVLGCLCLKARQINPQTLNGYSFSLKRPYAI